MCLQSCLTALLPLLAVAAREMLPRPLRCLLAIGATLILLQARITYGLLLSTIPSSAQRHEILSHLRKKARKTDLTIRDLDECLKLAPGRTEIEVLLGPSCNRAVLREQWLEALGQNEKKHLSLEEALGCKAWKSSLAEDYANVEANLERFRRVVVSHNIQKRGRSAIYRASYGL